MIDKIGESLFLVESPEKGRLPYCYCLYIEGECRALIDTSCGEQNIKELKARGVDLIINSHFHEDHILLNNSLPDARVWAHAMDIPAIRSLEVFNEFYGFPAYGLAQLGWDFIRSVNLQASRVDDEINDGQVIDFGGISCVVLHAPGHSPGHCCFFFEKEGLLFSSDIDLAGFGPWYGNVCGNVTDFIRSIELCRDINPRLVLSSHKGLIGENIRERMQSYVDVIYRREEAVIAALQSKPASLDELARLKIVYGPKAVMDEWLWFMETVSIQLHLDRLLELSVIRTDGHIYWIE